MIRQRIRTFDLAVPVVTGFPVFSVTISDDLKYSRLLFFCTAFAHPLQL